VLCIGCKNTLRNAEFRSRIFCGMWDVEKTCGMRYNLRNGKMRKSHLTAYKLSLVSVATIYIHNTKYSISIGYTTFVYLRWRLFDFRTWIRPTLFSAAIQHKPTRSFVIITLFAWANVYDAVVSDAPNKMDVAPAPSYDVKRLPHVDSRIAQV